MRVYDRGQDPENQLQDLRAWCAAAGHAVMRTKTFYAQLLYGARLAFFQS
jgi:hypothetical protein